jgi:hypothetical protein
MEKLLGKCIIGTKCVVLIMSLCYFFCKNYNIIIKCFRTYEILSPNLMIAEPKLINQVLVEDFQKFSTHRVINAKFKFIHL